MIIHIVLLQLESKNYNEMNKLIEQLSDLRNSTIPQIQNVTYGVNSSPEGLGRGYSYGFTMYFNTKEDRDYYIFHPDHIKIADRIVELLPNKVESALVLDYEF